MHKLSFTLLYACCIVVGHAQPGKAIDYVNPFIGTQSMGHTFPGATVPFGMVQLSPDTDTLQYLQNGQYNPDVYKYCAGYQYNDKTIVGFSHTHFSGTGHSDLGDFLIMPTVGKAVLNPGLATVPHSGYRSAYSHQRETAKPGYYSVVLDDYNIKAELTATERVGFHQYTFPKTDSAHIVLDLSHGIYNYPGKNIWSVIRIENDTLITGYRQTQGWARTRMVYFAMVLSKPISSYMAGDAAKKEPYKGFWRKFDQKENFPDLAGKDLKLCLNFGMQQGERIKIKMALSGVSIDGALNNLKTEVPHFDFERTVRQAADKWEKELAKISIEAPADIQKNFYTAMYHAFIAPNIFMDVDGQYKGLDYNTHKADGFNNYTTFSLWDTYRALHPLYNIIQTKRNADMVQSMLAHYNQSALHMLPIWSHYANDNWCMSGYHSVSVIADAIVKGANVDVSAALAACVATAKKQSYEGIGDYMRLGFVPAQTSNVSVSNTLEYAYDDWCIAQLAQKAGNKAVYEEFMERAGNYKNVFDAKDGFMKAKNAAGQFTNSFDALSTNHQGFIEGNSWNYSFFVPHEPESLVTMMGGPKAFARRLDTLFTMYLPDKYFAETEDITREGIIGTYVHGNEPAHHVAYLYNFAGQPFKTQERLRLIMHNQYKPAPDGLGGNDDCGQMSAWYIFSALGFYPVAPGAASYQLGSPIVNSAILQLENGKTLKITADNQSEKNKYVKAVYVNGRLLKGTTLQHADMMNGGEIRFVMSSQPQK